MKRITYKKGQIPEIKHSGIIYSTKYDKFYIVTWHKTNLVYHISDVKTGQIIFQSPYSFSHEVNLKIDIRRKLKELGVL